MSPDAIVQRPDTLQNRRRQSLYQFLIYLEVYVLQLAKKQKEYAKSIDQYEEYHNYVIDRKKNKDNIDVKNILAELSEALFTLSEVFVCVSVIK